MNKYKGNLNAIKKNHSLLGPENRSKLSTNPSHVVRYDYHENKK